MSRVIIFYTTKLAEFEAVHVFNGSRIVEVLHPHSHTHIFHLEQLYEIMIFQRHLIRTMLNLHYLSQGRERTKL